MSDKYTGYVDEMLVKGTWWAFNGGPKPRNFTGNIDNDPESIRNLSLIITGASQSNGHFPNDNYGKKYAVLTIRYGESDNRLYIQKVIDIDSKIEYERYYQGSEWGTYARVTSWPDSNDRAQQAYDQSRMNLGAINSINQAIGREGYAATGNTVNGRLSNIETNITGTNGINSKITSLQNGNSNDQYARDQANIAKDHSNKIINNDVRTGQKAGMKFYANQNEYTLNSPESSVIIIEKSVCDNWGANSNNSMFFVSNANSNVSPVHIDGGTFVPNVGWAAVFDRDYAGRIIINWMLVVIDQSVI